MSDFGVTLERIERVWAHPNADRLELAKVESMTFQFVIAKGAYQAGDSVLYFPIDSLIPSDLADKMGVRAYLAGKEHNRVKTARLRGAISQGIVISPSKLLTEAEIECPLDYAAMLGVTKWEPEPVMTGQANLSPLPAGFEVYDIQGAERYQGWLAGLMEQDVLVTEKVEGSHFSASLFRDDTFVVCQRRATIIELEGKEHVWWKVARALGLPGKLAEIRRMAQTTKGWLRNEDPASVTIRGEMIGPKIQGNYYMLPTNQVLFFEIEIDGKPLAGQDFLEVANRLDLPMAPFVYSGKLAYYLDGRSLVAESNGDSLIAPGKLREGIVVRPLLQEQVVTNMNTGASERLILKQRSPEYLAATDN